MSIEAACPCGSLKAFETCCEPYLIGTTFPQTAEALMRSRYVAYAVNDSAYLLNTTHPSNRKLYNATELERWAKENHWQKLKIVATSKGLKQHNEGIVEFKAYFIDSKGITQQHHERSTFIKEKGQWYFLKGKVY